MSLTTIAYFYTLPDAYIALSKLRSNGIEAFLFDDNIIAANFLYANAVGGARLNVLEKDREVALALLDEEISLPTEKNNSEQKCSACHSSKTMVHYLKMLIVFLAFTLFSIPLLLHPYQKKCQNCMR